jgi:hypothetical protein
VNILDIDIDAFLDPRPRRKATSGRLSSNDYRPWSHSDVEDFLTRRCNLRKDRPLPGGVVTYHHELFDHWNSLIESGQIDAPFHLTHVDSHADMGMGDASAGYIMGELLHHAPDNRNHPKRCGDDGLLEGNYVSFALACQWISSIDYIHHPQLFSQSCKLHDIPDCLFRDNDPHCGAIQLKKLPRDCHDSVQRLTTFTPIELEPEVPIRFIKLDDFCADDAFAFVFAAHSPNYTPSTSDSILKVIRDFIRSN